MFLYILARKMENFKKGGFLCKISNSIYGFKSGKWGDFMSFDLVKCMLENGFKTTTEEERAKMCEIDEYFCTDEGSEEIE